MAKTKWIVPAVALVLCAASLIGAGYAAYSATLQDSETQNLTSNYIELEMGSSTLGAQANVYWTYAGVSTNGGAPTKTYTPYLDEACTEDVAKTAELGSFKIMKTEQGTISDADTFNLVADNLTFTTGSLTGASIIVVNEAGTAATMSALSYNTVYKVLLSYTQDGDNDQVTSDPPATLVMTYELTATANLS